LSGELTEASVFYFFVFFFINAGVDKAASRKTADKAIGILQGRCVGGSTTVNWTSSFRTPSLTLKLPFSTRTIAREFGRRK